MANPRYHRAQSTTANPQSVEHLYDLGLLPRPREPSPGDADDTFDSVNEGSALRSSDRAPDTAKRVRYSHHPPSKANSAAPPSQLQRGATQLASPVRSAGSSRSSTDIAYLHSNPSQTSFNWRAGRSTAGMLDIERNRSRRERTFIGTECAVCEEPLEHTLRGEKVLQLSCAHVSHEACFYEYLKEFESHSCPTCDAPLGLDTSRGGNVIDLEKLSTIVRSATMSDSLSRQPTPVAWETPGGRDHLSSSRSPSRAFNGQAEQDSSHRESRDMQHEKMERLDFGSRNQSTDSAATDLASPDYGDAHQNGIGRRHDYDVQSMETDLSSQRRGPAKNPIPAPVVTVRSEFPTLNRSRQQQSLTCLVTIEVPEGKWNPNPEDFRHTPPGLAHLQDDSSHLAKSPVARSSSRQSTYESPEVLEEITEELRLRVDNWHGLDFQRFGKLRLSGAMRVGKDRKSWQELECYLFGEMLICVKEKKGVQALQMETKRKKTRCTLKGSILIKKHLQHVDSSPDEPILTLNLSVNELSSFHLLFDNRNQLELWKHALNDLHNPDSPTRFHQDYDLDTSGTDDEEYGRHAPSAQRGSSMNSSYGAGRSNNTAPTEYTASLRGVHDSRMSVSMHVPLDIVVVVPVSSSMQGLKITLLRDTLKFLVQNLGERDRMGLVTFGSNGGGVPLVGMASKAWTGWNKILDSIRPAGQKSLRADVVEGANVAMDLLMQRKSANPLSTIMLISDSSSSDGDSVEFVVQRAEAAKVTIHSFGLGLTHKPDNMVELSTRTKASFLYVKDWMMLRECVAGCLGSLQTTSHQNVKLKLKLPEGSPAKFVKISGALQVSKRATGKDVEASLGDLRFGDKRDILVQLAIAPDNGSQDHLPQDPWETIVSGLEALGGPIDSEEHRVVSIEEVPLLQADLRYGDILREGTLTHLPRPSLLAITMLPANPRTKANGRPTTPLIPPHPLIVQRRMELLTSDMLTRALTLAARNQHDRAHHLLHETRTILKGLGKGGLPPLPGANGKSYSASNSPTSPTGSPRSETPERQPSLHSQSSTIGSGPAVDAATMAALDADIEASLEWINHPAVFSRDQRKAVLQAIGVVSSQRAYTFRTPSEALWADRISGVKRLTERSRDWREAGDDALTEES